MYMMEIVCNKKKEGILGLPLQANIWMKMSDVGRRGDKNYPRLSRSCCCCLWEFRFPVFQSPKEFFDYYYYYYNYYYYYYYY